MKTPAAKKLAFQYERLRVLALHRAVRVGHTALHAPVAIGHEFSSSIESAVPKTAAYSRAKRGIV
jgi:hypothetical protein